MSPKNESKILQVPDKKTHPSSHVPPITNQQKSHTITKYRLNRNLVSSKSAPPSIYRITSSLKKPDKNVLSQTSNPSFATNTPFKMVGRASSGNSKQQASATLIEQRIGNLKWAKNNSGLHLSRLESENKRGQSMTKHLSSIHSWASSKSDKRTIVLPDAARPLRKTTSAAATITRRPSATGTPNGRVVVLPKNYRAATPTLPARAAKDTTTLIRSVANVPKMYNTSSKALTSMNKDTVPTSALANRRIVNLSKSHKSSSNLTSFTDISRLRTVPGNTRKIAVKGATSLDKRPLPRANPRVGAATTNSVQSSAVSKGAKLKWRRKSAGQLTNDAAVKNTRSKNLHGNELQTRLALKSKWRKTGPVSFTRKKAISNARSRHSRADLVYTRHAKDILHSRTMPHPKHSSLKWSKSSSQASLFGKSDLSSARTVKPRFAHNSRFSLKRRRSSDGGKVLAGDYLGSSRVHYRTGAIGKVKSQNTGFLARWVKFLVLLLAIDVSRYDIKRGKSDVTRRLIASSKLTSQSLNVV